MGEGCKGDLGAASRNISANRKFWCWGNRGTGSITLMYLWNLAEMRGRQATTVMENQRQSED